MGKLSTNDAAKLLGVPIDIKLPALNKYWRTLAKQYHPDLHPNDKKAEERFRQLNEAYTILSSILESVRQMHGLEESITDHEFEIWIRNFTPEQRKKITEDLKNLEKEENHNEE